MICDQAHEESEFSILPKMWFLKSREKASDLQITIMETMEAVELEKQKHNDTRMEVLSQLAKLERANADLIRSLAKLQKNLQVEMKMSSALKLLVENQAKLMEEMQALRKENQQLRQLL